MTRKEYAEELYNIIQPSIKNRKHCIEMIELQLGIYHSSEHVKYLQQDTEKIKQSLNKIRNEQTTNH